MTDATTHDELLFVGDVHLGRRPVGLDGVLADVGVAAGELSPAVALANVVEEALARRPRAVVFAGDVVDQDDDRFEAYGHLERAVRRLTEAGVAVCGVAGNHDGVALPRLAERVPGFRLLGKGGVWERMEIPGEGRPIDLVGWSFPRRHFPSSPLDEPGFAEAVGGARAGATVLGVLHCDLDAGRSSYAPVRRSDLEATSVAGWFLGHVHRPGDLAVPRPVGYLGSLVGLDPGEPGPRGPWRVRVEEGGVAAEQVPLVPVRFETFDVALDDESATEEDAVHAAVERAAHALVRDDPTLGDSRLRVVVARATLTGRVTDRGPVRAFTERHAPTDTVFETGTVPVVVQKVTDATRAAVDLDALAREPSPVGHVARVLVALRDGKGGEVLSCAGDAVRGVVDRGWDVDEDDHPPPVVADVTQRAAWRVLDTLLAQREETAA